MFIDSHCHLSFPELRQQLPAVLSAMAAAQVSRALCVCTTLEEFETVYALAAEHPQLWATVGVHPDNEGIQEPTVDDLVSRARRHPKVLAVGETGLDYYRLNGRSIEDMAWQRARFVAHIQAARITDLPLVIHTRSASADTLSLLETWGGFGPGADPLPGLPPARGVFHCFTETQAVAQAALAMGFYLSFSGILTFRNATDLREVVRQVPLDRLLIETDSPYLAPVPHRGKTNTPAFVPLVAQQVADIKGVPLTAVAAATSDNFEQLFKRPLACEAA